MKFQKITKKLAKKIAVALDEDKDTKISEVNHRDLQKILTVDYPSFSAILPYRFFWEEKKLFINEHGIGFGLELTVFSGADEKLVNSVADLLRHRIDDNTDLQFILWGSNQVGNIIDEAYKHQVNGNSICSELAKASVEYYKKGAKEGFKNKLNLPTTLREYRLFAFLSKSISAYSESAISDIETIRDNFTIELESAGIGFVNITLKNFLPTLRSWVNPDVKNIYLYPANYEEYSTLNEQVVDKSFELIHDPERLSIEINSGTDDIKKTKITNLSIKNLPDEFALWESPDNFFNVFRASQAIRCPFLISMHARLIPQNNAKTKAQSTYLSTEKKANSVYAKYFPGTREAALEWKKIRDDLASDTVKLAKVYFNLVLFSNIDEEKKDESSAISSYRYNGIELFNTKYMQLQSFLATLPFVMSEGMHQDLNKAGRLKTLTTWNLANLLPIVADFKMCFSRRHGVLLSSFRNQINFFDMYSEDLPTANYNIAVAATSGAGKSFLVQNILSYVLSINGRCFVIDLGQSYRKFCEIVGGTYLEYHSLRLNPFSNIHNINEASEQIRDLLSVLASPSGVLDDVQEEYLRQAVIDAWDKKQRKTNIDDIIDALQGLNLGRNDNRIKDLIVLLTRYSTKGPYPNIFNDYSAIAPDASFVVLELGELENKPDLMKAVLFALILNIEEQMYQSPRNQPKMVVIDEAWRLLSGDNKAAARFIEKGYRTARRHYGSFVTITQSIEDFQKSDEAKACWNCSDIKAIMLQNSKAFDDFMLSHKDYFDPYVTSLIKNFKEARNNGFSEFMLQTGRIQSFCRLFVDPFSRVMFSSAGKEFAAVEEYQKRGLSIAESILKVAQDNYPEEFEKMKLLSFLKVFAIGFFVTNLAYAKNLGVWGQLFPIEEQDIREFIYQRLNEMEQNGEMAILKEKFTQNVKEHTLRPAPVSGLATIKESEKPKIFYYDPTYILNKDIEDHEGNIIAKRGTVINPLDTIKLHGVLFFLDADDKRQIKWALNNAKKYDHVRYILVKGNIKEAGKKLNDRIYFDQYGSITHKLGIHYIPCIVKQKEKKLQIQEFALEEFALEGYENNKNNKIDERN